MPIWAADTLERELDGVRRYILARFDPGSRMGFALALEALILGLSAPQQRKSARRGLDVLSDNGPEKKSTAMPGGKSMA